ncbi:MAG: PAS domain S-box protein [Methylococcales bacterium]|nr:PAS domain S-box protein [Methylococcales bacterium]
MQNKDNSPKPDAQPEDVQQILQALHTHQIELEMQNDELRRAYLELDSARARYVDLYDLAPVSYCTLNDKGQLILQANITAATLLGVPRNKLIQQPISRFILKQDQDTYYLHCNQLIKTGISQSCELRMRKQNGTHFWVHLTATVARDETDNALEIRIMLNDITERKQAENKLRISDHALKAISQGVLITDANWHTLSVNNAFTSITGYSQSEIIGLTTSRLLQGVLTDSQTVTALNRAMHNAIEFSGEILNYRKDGSTFWNDLSISPVFDTNGQLTNFIGIIRDITERKQVENTLLQNEKKMTTILEGAADAIFITDQQGSYRYVNQEACTLLGYTRDELLNMAIPDTFSSEDLPEILQLFNTLLTTGSLQFEALIKAKDGRLIPVDVNGTVLADGSVFGSCRNITARKQIEALLLDSEHRYRVLLQSARDATMITDTQGNLEEINQAGLLLVGYDLDEMLQMNVVNIHPDTERIKIQQYFDACSSHKHILPIETQLLCKNGQVVDVEIRSTLVAFGDRNVVQNVFIDLTDRNRFEKQRLEREKIHRDALVREIHHRIKNNLQGITGVLRHFAQEHPETANPINQAISQVHSISVIYGLQGRAVNSKVHVGELVLAIAAGIESLWKKSIRVTIPKTCPPYIIIEVEAVPLALVLNELTANAIKHSNSDEPVSITLSCNPHHAALTLVMHNPGLLKADFMLGAINGLGIGLQLVTALLPLKDALLSLTQQDNRVVTTLELKSPIIYLESSTHEHDA